MLGDLSNEQVRKIIRDSFGSSAMPQLQDPQWRAKSIDAARKQALDERIKAELADEEPIAVLPRSKFRQFQLNGNRSNYEKVNAHRSRQIELAAMACWLGLDKFEYLQDLLWAACEQTWWILPAHEANSTPIDLYVAMEGCRLSTIATMFRDKLDGEVLERIVDEVQGRIIRPYLAPRDPLWWKVRDNNWNAVCLGGVGISALLLETQATRLARLIADVLDYLPNFLDSFTPDGGCSEGPSYWSYGFGWFIRLAAALHDFTGGKIDIASGDRVGRICRYPLVVAVRPGMSLAFADAQQRPFSPHIAQLVNRYQDLPELFGLCPLDDQGNLRIATLEDLLVYDGKTHQPLEDRRDYLLADLAVAKLISGELVLGVKAGHNGENHNHNDLGSFLLYRSDTIYLTDPGAPIYSKRTFSARRYESIFCNSFGHSVPVINGKLQSTGKQFSATLQIEGLNTDSSKIARVEFAGAYDLPALKSLTRTIELPGDEEVRLNDEFAFAGAPESLEEAFITTHPAEVIGDGLSVTISPEGAEPATLSADTPGRFEVAELVEESKAESRRGELIRRITFTPSKLRKKMTLKFVVRFA
ncbi:MAG: heparinase II/III family protein [Planctomycetes bacterium]|nr:heparinase II/III family protein [Planctomycetota bacterium]